MSTASPTSSPTEDLSEYIGIFVMVLSLGLCLLFLCFCVFLSHSKNVAAAHKIIYAEKKQQIEELLKSKQIKYKQIKSNNNESY